MSSHSPIVSRRLGRPLQLMPASTRDAVAIHCTQHFEVVPKSDGKEPLIEVCVVDHYSAIGRHNLPNLGFNRREVWCISNHPIRDPMNGNRVSWNWNPEVDQRRKYRPTIVINDTDLDDAVSGAKACCLDVEE